MNDNFYKQLMEQSPLGYAYYKIICDEMGKPCDFAFLEVNQAFETLTGIKGDDIIGKTITMVLPAIKKNKFDWIAYLGELALKGEEKEFEEYSEPLKKWFKVKAYAPEEGAFVTVFSDVSNERKQIKAYQKLSVMSEEFLQWTGEEIDYQAITDNFLELSEAKFSVFNLYEEDGKTYTTMAIAGDKGIITKAMTIMGLKLNKKKWLHDPLKAAKIKDKIVTCFPTLHDLAATVIPRPISKLLTKRFSLGETVIIKIMKTNIMLGDFTLIMAKGKTFDKDHLAEIFTRQLGLILTRVQAEGKIKSNEAHLNALVTNTPAVIYSYTLGIDGNPNLTYINDNVTNVLGFKPEDFVGNMKFWADCVHPEDMPKLQEKLAGNEILNEYRFKDIKGDYHWLLDQQRPYKKETGLTEIVGTWWDISDRKEMEEQLKESELFNQKILDSLPGIFYLYTYPQLELVRYNNSHETLLGYEAGEIANHHLLDWFNPEIKPMVEQTVDKVMLTGQSVLESSLLSKNGDYIPFLVTGLSFDTPEQRYLMGIGIDIKERKKIEKQIEFLSYNDQLTDLYNRRYYEQEKTRLDAEGHYPLALIMADVNGLKLTNDAFGHQAGDLLLQTISNILKSACREKDIIARIGGDEFVLLLPQTDAKNVQLIIDRINAAIENEKIDTVILSLSMGYAVKQEAFQNLDEIFMKAEDAMYRHKLSQTASMRSKTIDLIKSTLFEQNNWEKAHSQRVGSLCQVIAEKMDLTKDEVSQLKVAGQMHDIGKIGIDQVILNKPDKLTINEWEEVRRHSEIGYRILCSVNEFSQIANYVLEHHEKWDGSGYPHGLKGKAISLPARILALADAYDAMTQASPYKKALSQDQAIAEVKKWSGRQFDPDIAKLFIEEVLTIYPTNSQLF